MPCRAKVLAVGLVCGLLAGCAGPTLAPVTGKVTCNGKPVKDAAITFSLVPASEDQKETGKPATGWTEADGSYYLSTFKDRDGALIGKHSVLVVLDDTNPAKCKREQRITWEVKPGTNEVNIELNN
jgi:hypothetical protein